jgi:hypothetical protein
MVRVNKEPLGANSDILRHVPFWFDTYQDRLGNVRYKMRYAGMTQSQIDEMEERAKEECKETTICFLDYLWNIFEEWKGRRNE